MTGDPRISSDRLRRSLTEMARCSVACGGLQCSVSGGACAVTPLRSALAPSPAAWRGKSKKVNVQQIRRSKQ